METEHDLSIHIVKLTVLIQEKYPELYRNLGEMYATLPNKEIPVINTLTLRKWLDSLNALVSKYDAFHQVLPSVTMK